MSRKATHEPHAAVMSAQEVWTDAQQLAQVLRQNMLTAEPVVRLQIPLSAWLSALETLSQDELIVLHQRVEERLAR